MKSITFALALTFSLVVGDRAVGQLRRMQSSPSDEYYVGLRLYHSGEYGQAARVFRQAARSGAKTADLRWVDGVCCDTMIGECLFRIGDLPAAVEFYNSALQVFLANGNWLQQLQFPNQIQPRQPFPIPWGPSTRNALPGIFGREQVLSRFATINAQALLKNNLLISQDELYPLDAVEILRCTCVALARRQQLLGPVSSQDTLAARIERGMGGRIVQPGHWAKPILDVVLAFAKASSGAEDEAMRLLPNSLTVGPLDHPLTAIALLQLGRMALARDQFEVAEKSFLEATISAAQYEQYDVLEEAFVLAGTTRRLAGRDEPLAALELAAAWTRSRDAGDRATAALLVVMAENASLAGQTDAAMALLTNARKAMARTDLLRADLGSRLQYLTALVNYQLKRQTAGDEALTAALAYQDHGSHRLFQIATVHRLAKQDAISHRIASTMLGEVLRESTPKDWRMDPLECLTELSTPNLESLEFWLQIAFGLEDVDTAVKVGDRIRRAKFFAALPLHGRQLSLQWIVEADEQLLDDATKTQRQNLLAKFPQLAELSGQAKRLKESLAQMPPIPSEGETRIEWEKLAKELATISQRQEELLREISLRPEPSSFMFPPIRSVDQIRSGLRPGQAVVDIIATQQQTYVAMFSSDKGYKHWSLPASARVRVQLTTMLKSFGNFERNKPLTAAQLSNRDWEKSAKELHKVLFGENGGSLEGVDEIIIVPDGVFWYLPFEGLVADTNQGPQPLISVFKIRYVPTASLAVNDPRLQPALPSSAIVSGRLYSRELDVAVARAAERIGALSPQSSIVSKAIPVAAATVAHRWDRLVVLDDIEGIDEDPFGWSPAQVDAKTKGGKLLDWISLPWGGPDQIVLPGFHTAAENGLRGRSSGDEVLLSTLAMMAGGSRTILLSRWRTGGQSSLDLVREFLTQLPTESPATAWQRSVQLARSSPIDSELEPRIKGTSESELPTGEHPFFWAGFQLLDLGQK